MDKFQSVLEKTLDKKLSVANGIEIMPTSKAKVAQWLCNQDTNAQTSPKTPSPVPPPESSSVTPTPAFKRKYDDGIDLEVLLNLNGLEENKSINFYFISKF